MITFPADVTDVIRLGDWLELKAVAADDQNASINDLVSPLRIAGAVNAYEQIIMQVLREIEHRAVSAGQAYPFRLRRGVLRTRPNRSNYAAYLFCLGLSYFGWKQRRNAAINPWFLFEDLACIAAEQYLQGEIYRFGARGQRTDRSFRNSIDELSLKLGEGKGFREQPTLRRQDDKVDLVVWKHFSDKKPSKVIMFGQCAAGDNWTGKVTELQPQAFWDHWLVDGPISPHLRSFYVPHRILPEQWDYYARYAGILFDRCRVAYWAFKNNRAVLANRAYYQWFESILSPRRRQARSP